MKKTTQNLMWLLMILSVLTFVATGCQNTQQTAYKASATVIYTVDAGMKAWADYVHQGYATIAQEDEVKFRYEQYQKATVLAQVALKTWMDKKELDPYWQTALIAMDSAKGKLLELINSFMQKPVVRPAFTPAVPSTTNTKQ